MMPGPRSRSNSFVPINGYREAVETAKRPHAQAAGCFKSDRLLPPAEKVGRGWLVGDKRRSEKIVERLEQLTIVGQAVKAAC